MGRCVQSGHGVPLAGPSASPSTHCSVDKQKPHCGWDTQLVQFWTASLRKHASTRPWHISPGCEQLESDSQPPPPDYVPVRSLHNVVVLSTRQCCDRARHCQRHGDEEHKARGRPNSLGRRHHHRVGRGNDCGANTLCTTRQRRAVHTAADLWLCTPQPEWGHARHAPRQERNGWSPGRPSRGRKGERLQQQAHTHQLATTVAKTLRKQHSLVPCGASNVLTTRQQQVPSLPRAQTHEIYCFYLRAT